MNRQQNPLTDKKGLLAVVLIGVFFVLWQWFMEKTYPKPKPASPVSAASTNQASPESVARTEKTPGKAEEVGSQEMKSAPEVMAEKVIKFEGQNLNFNVSSIGMGLKEVTLKNYTDREHKPIRLGELEAFSLFEMRLKEDQPLSFNLSEKEKGHFVGQTIVDGMTIVREIRFDDSKQSFESTIEISSVKEGAFFSLIMPDRIHQPQSSSFLFPSYDHQDFFVNHDEKSETLNFSSAKSDVRGEYKNVHLAAVSSQYFTTSILDHSDIVPEFLAQSNLAKKEAVARFIYKPGPGAKAKLSQTFFVGPKSIDILEKINPDLSQIINFGSLSVIARPMLMIMKGFYSWVQNWGLAIILLTLLVRLAVFPLYMMSMKSMKAMQKIQPLMKELKEKYKDDPMTANRETMALMKQHKANPLGGCLPMLLQIPIFFALFRVIGSSVELYQAPFGLWIKDLSLHDPYFVLPVLMGITMFLQQKLTPTSMDPAQAKILMFMPILFSVFMLYLPSGLTLYMFISGLFGITQQYVMMRGGPAPATIEAKASRLN